MLIAKLESSITCFESHQSSCLKITLNGNLSKFQQTTQKATSTQVLPRVLALLPEIAQRNSPQPGSHAKQYLYPKWYLRVLTQFRLVG